MTLEGGCLCGSVRYRIEEDTPPCYACHCTECQTHSGSAFVLQMPVFATKFVVDGEVVSADQQLPNDRVSTIHCCPNCLVRLYATVTGRDGLVTVRAGTLDTSKELTPVAHIWVRSKQDWVDIPEGHQTFEQMPSESDWFELLNTANRLQAG